MRSVDPRLALGGAGELLVERDRSPSPSRRIESPPSETMLSGPSSIRSWSRVRCGEGSRSKSAAGPRASQNGTWTAGRRVPSAVFIRRQSSFHVTGSGPPSSIGPPVPSRRGRRAAPRARGRRSRSAAHAASPGPITGVTGASRAMRRNRGSAPPSVPNTKLGRSTTCSIPQPRDRLLGGPLRAEVRDGRPGPGSERAHQHDPPHVALARRLDEVPGARRHDALERRGRALDDRDEVDDRAHAACSRAERGQGRSRRRERGRSARRRAPPAPRASRTIARTALAVRREVAGHVATDEAAGPVTRIIRRPRSSASTCSASALAGPGTSTRAPPEPYGVSAGSDICTKESWPIFMPG